MSMSVPSTAATASAARAAGGRAPGGVSTRRRVRWMASPITWARMADCFRPFVAPTRTVSFVGVGRGVWPAGLPG